MGSRKRAKPNPAPQPPADNSTVDPTPPPLSNPGTPGRPLVVSEGEAPLAGQVSVGGNVNTQASTRSWYGGTWPRISKSIPITQVAHETISTASSVNEISGSRPTATPKIKEELRMSPSLYLPTSIQTSPRSLPAVATTTKLNITSNGLVEAPIPECAAEERPARPKEDEPMGDSETSHKPECQEQVPPTSASDRAVAQYSWLGWFSKPIQAESGMEILQPCQGAPSAEGPKLGVQEPVKMSYSSPTVRQTPDQLKDTDKNLDATPPAQYARSWLGFWSGSAPIQNQNGRPPSNDTLEIAQNKSELPLDSTLSVTNESLARDPVDTPMTEAPLELSSAKTKTISDGPSGWTFWSIGRAKPIVDHSTMGEMVSEPAIVNAPSLSHPQAPRDEENNSSAIFETAKLGKRGRPKSLDITDDSISHIPEVGPSTGKAAKPVEQTTKQQAQKPLPANLLLPSFNNTYHQQESPSILQQLARLLLQGKQMPTRHVQIVREPPHVRKAIAIGIHGYFPAPLIRTVLGQPTGTSVRFANSAATAIKKWTQSRGYECDIEKIALEGEGKIGERVDTLWKSILNRIDKIQKADFILVACHSQGVPVAIILVSKLIEFGCLNAARVGICAMAGVNLGPFPDYKSRLFNGSAGELFEFSNPNSIVSKRYEDAMGVAVGHGVRILLVGSIDDQLVSLESSTFSTISHPYIYRAVFVDGRVHAPDFLAVEHALESSSVGDIPLQVSKYEVPTNSNPFILPWSMRGLLEEEYVRTELYDETTQLLEQFDNWKPTSKALKDVKFRLEAVKSKL